MVAVVVIVVTFVALDAAVVTVIMERWLRMESYWHSRFHWPAILVQTTNSVCVSENHAFHEPAVPIDLIASVGDKNATPPSKRLKQTQIRSTYCPSGYSCRTCR
jgi:hypothetical protein